MGEWYRLILGALTTWRLTHLFNAEDGPWQMFVRIRRAAGDSFVGELLDCFYCLSLWIAAPLAVLLGRSWPERLLLIPALSAAAIVVERMTAPAAPPMPLYIEDQEVPDGMLRKESDPSGDTDGARQGGGGDGET